MLSAIIGVLFLFADQLIKFWTVSHVELNTGIRELFPGILHLTYIKNYGAAFGLFSNAPWLRWVLLGLLVCFTLFILLGVRRGGYLRTGFSRFTGLMLLAGLLGNGIDRAIYGYVVDMFELEFINFAIFNLADMLVVVFGILFCISLIAGGIGAADEFEEDEEEAAYNRRHRSREEESPRPRRTSSEGQARRSSGSGQQPHRPSGSGQSARRSSGSGQQPRRPSGSGSQPTRRPRAEEETPRPRRPRPEESGMSVRPLVTTPAPEATPAETAAPAPEAVPVETAAPAPEVTPVEAAAPAPEAPEKVAPAAPAPEAVPVETVPEADATRPFQPVSVPVEPKAEPGATRPFQPVAKTGDTQTYQPAAKAPETPAAAPGATQVYQPAAKPAAKPASKASDEFDLDSILAEFK